MESQHPIFEREALPVQTGGEDLWVERLEAAEKSLQASQEYLQLLGDSAPFGIFTVDLKGRVTGRNRKAKEMFPWPAEQDTKDIPTRDIPFLSASQIEQELFRCMQTGEKSIRENPCMIPGGDCLQVRFYFSPMRHSDGAIAGVMVFAEDVTLIRLAKEAAAESGRRYHMLFQFSPVAMIERDASELKQYLVKLRSEGVQDLDAYLDANPGEIAHCMGMIRTIDFNYALMRLLEAPDREALQLLGNQFHSEEQLEIARDIILMIDQGNVSQEKERMLHTVKGDRKIVLARSLAVTDHEDNLSRIVIALVDITKRKESEEALRTSEQKFREMAFRDNLTGLYNRRYLYQTLPFLMDQCRADGKRLSLIFMDLDHFKQVVDTHGHLNGSLAIREVAEVLQSTLKEPAYAVAYAGDEFVVVLPGTDTAGAVQHALQIRSAISDAVYLVSEGLAVKLQVSIGIATFPDHAPDLAGLLSAADKALFKVKGDGKGAIQVHLE